MSNKGTDCTPEEETLGISYLFMLLTVSHLELSGFRINDSRGSPCLTTFALPCCPVFRFSPLPRLFPFSSNCPFLLHLQ